MRDFLLISLSGGLLILAVVAWVVRDDLAADMAPVMDRWAQRAVEPGPAPPPQRAVPPSADPAGRAGPVEPPAPPAATPPPAPASAPSTQTAASKPTRSAPTYDAEDVTRLPANLARTDIPVGEHRRTRVEARPFGASRWSDADLRRRAEAVCAAAVAQLAERGLRPVFRVDAQVGPGTHSAPIPVTVERGRCARLPAPPAPVPLVLSPDLAHLPVEEMAVWRYGSGRAVRVALGGGGPVTEPEAMAVCRLLVAERDHVPPELRRAYRLGALIVTRAGRDHVLAVGGRAAARCRPVEDVAAYGPMPPG